MRIIGCDLHSRQQTLAVLNTETGEVEERVLEHEGNEVREFYSGLPGPVRVGIEASCATQMVFAVDGRVGRGVLGGTPGQDPCVRAAQAEE